MNPFQFIFLSFAILFNGMILSAQVVLNWQMKHPRTEVYLDAGSHGSVQELLVEAGELPDPFYETNEKLFQWIEDYTWEFTSEFTVSGEMLLDEFVELKFPGIDTYGEIFLNNQRIGFAENAFKPYYFEVKDKLKIGQNKLKVIFYPPVLYHKEAFSKARYTLPATNDVGSIAVAPYTRKPQYQFGWDWALRINTIGFLKPVTLDSYSLNRIKFINCVTDSANQKSANLYFELQLEHPASETLIWNSVLFGKVQIDKGEQLIRRNETISEPHLWWPRGQGEQFLYTDTWQLTTLSGIPIENKSVRFGIRTAELVMQPDKWGTSYVIRVNGRAIFCKGADYIPQDIFPAKVKDAELRKMVEEMTASNFNMVRIWGGGYYPDEAFYNACDSLGIMVWQDFMFACAMYPGDPDFLENVKGELEYQIPRIASHPSLVLFNGNNEVDVAWKNWGFQSKYNLDSAACKEIEAAYDRLFKKLIPSTVERFTNIPYIHTSPLSNWGKEELYKHGTQHYWGVWHGKDPMDDFGKKIGRFNAEYGFQSFPEYATLASFSERKDWSLESEVMKHHQKSYVGNGMILKHAKLLLGEPKDFEEFVYFSQLTQAKAISLAVTGHRLDAPRCMGTLYWQLNDCWPAPTWSSIDYFGNWKALHYWIKKDYEDVAVVSKFTDDGDQEFYVVSDQSDTFDLEVNYVLFNLEGKELCKGSFKKQFGGLSKEKICHSCIEDKLNRENWVIEFSWNDPNGVIHKRAFSHLPRPTKKALHEDVTVSVIKNSDGTLDAVVSTKKYLKDFWLYATTSGVRFEDNFIDLLPGTHTIRMSVPFRNTQIPQLEMKWR